MPSAARRGPTVAAWKGTKPQENCLPAWEARAVVV
jgi:hypothetical protein